MRYQHRLRVQSPVETVAAFHRDPRALRLLTPPPIVVQVHQAPPRIHEGAELVFTLWLGPLPLHWQAKFTNVTAVSFCDVQQNGPFRRWEHTHSFVQASPDSTDVLDTLEIELRRHPIWGPVGWGMVRGLPLLFAYRGWRTRRLLERPPRAWARVCDLPRLGLALGAAVLLARRLCRTGGRR